MPKVRITMTFEYEPNPEYYPGSPTPEEMARMDKENDFHTMIEDWIVKYEVLE